MQNQDLHEELARLAQRVWRARNIPACLLDDPKCFLEENGIEIPAGYELRVTAKRDFMSFRFVPQQLPDVLSQFAQGRLRDGGLGELLFRFEFKLIWD